MSLEKAFYEQDLEARNVSDRLTAQEVLNLAHEFYTRITYLRYGDEPVMSTDRDAYECIGHYIGHDEFIGWILLSEKNEDLNETIIWLADDLYWDHKCDDNRCTSGQTISSCRDALVSAAQDGQCAVERSATPGGEVLEVSADVSCLPVGIAWLSARIEVDDYVGYMQIDVNDATGTALTDSIGTEWAREIVEAVS